ncbi:MAG: hypothetical protein JW793_12195 [Acidobacteria bacterium]|nr:hypothetical protein [Acidobacteriota bacterium]
MPDKAAEADEKAQNRKLKYIWRAALVGAIAALSGSFAYCVYHGHTQLHEDWCACCKYGAMVALAFSHPIIIIGALAGICVVSIAYLIRFVYKACRHHFHKDCA